MRWVLGFCGVMVAAVALFFGVVPAEKVDPAVHGKEHIVQTRDSDFAIMSDVVKTKSGLRIAIEGRLRWLGLL